MGGSSFPSVLLSLSVVLVVCWSVESKCVAFQKDVGPFKTAVAFVSNGTTLKPQPDLWKPCPLFRDAKEVCCSLSAFNALVMGKGSFSAFFSSCPACVNNLQTIWCNYGCRTDQEKYMWPTKFDSTDPQIIKEIAFNISLSYLTSVYKSCQDVSLPDGSKFPEMWGKTPIQFFEIMLSQSVMYGSPYDKMTAYYVDDTVPKPVSSPTTPCEDQCPCSVCSARCTGSRTSPLKDTKILGMSALNFGVAVGGGVFVILLIVFSFVIYHKQSQGFHGGRLLREENKML
eukprot:TRINITY_DN82291_c0_g1_i1.p1 TRINITY_DN82291_c0_g1~~TRINITY_DN82291_c0_g1_i1.p1  ORF type:complete len:285 (-),score=37.64 TRINITY_DN82291_c0_g1_i1:108-962(-)